MSKVFLGLAMIVSLLAISCLSAAIQAETIFGAAFWLMCVVGNLALIRNLVKESARIGVETWIAESDARIKRDMRISRVCRVR